MGKYACVRVQRKGVECVYQNKLDDSIFFFSLFRPAKQITGEIIVP